MAESLRLAAEAAGLVPNEETQATDNSTGEGGSHGVNVSELERWASSIGGGALAVYGI
jgi:hypothetical protein